MCIHGLTSVYSLAPMKFWQFLRRIQRERYPSANAFARALQVDPSYLSKAMQKGGAPFDLRGCFRLAHVTGTDLVVILKAAEKPEAEIAMIVEVIARCQRTTSTDPVKRGLYEAIDMLRDRGAIETCATLVRYIVGLPPLQPNAPTRASEVSEEARRTGT